MNDPFFAVDGGDAAFATFIRAAGDENFVVFADGDGADLTNVNSVHDDPSAQPTNTPHNAARRSNTCSVGLGWI
jgi:hypothetical protein